MNCKECKNNLAKEKDGYMVCPISLLKENKVEYDEEKQEFVCDKENIEPNEYKAKKIEIKVERNDNDITITPTGKEVNGTWNSKGEFKEGK